MTVSAIGDRQMRQHHGATWLDSEHHPAKRVTTSLPLHGQRHHVAAVDFRDRKSTRLNSSHGYISYAVFCLKKKKTPLFLIPNLAAQSPRLLNTCYRSTV